MRLGGLLESQGLDMSKPLLNGGNTGVVDASEEDAATMVASLQDHIVSCAKLQDTAYTGIEIKEERFPCDFDHMYASMAEHDSAAVAVEVRHLKELLLYHLDLIQQQSEQIVNKDKQLQNLRQENELLRQRLERMDRRVTLHHNKRQSGESPSFPSSGTTGSGSFPVEPPTSPSSPSAMSELPGAGSEEDETGSVTLQPFPKAEGSLSPRGSPLTINTGIKQNQHPQLQQQFPVLERTTRKSSWSSDTGITASRRPGISGTDVKETRSQAASPNVNTQSRRLRTSQSRRQASDSEVGPVPNVSELEVKHQKLTVPVSSVTTPILYFDCSETAVDTTVKTEEGCVSSQALLEVPSWRVRPYTSCYSMEGTENLEDEIFLKRHQRLELDERRRKRWDIQRLREQRQYEKLRQRQTQQQQQQQQQIAAGSRKGSTVRKGNQQQDVSQLWPDPENVQYIEVDEFLPVTAFGVPIPAFLPMCFELPWVVDKDKLQKMEEQEQVPIIKQEPLEEKETTPAPPPPSPDLPPPPPPPPQNSVLPRNNRRRNKGSSCERRRTSTRRR